MKKGIRFMLGVYISRVFTLGGCTIFTFFNKCEPATCLSTNLSNFLLRDNLSRSTYPLMYGDAHFMDILKITYKLDLNVSLFRPKNFFRGCSLFDNIHVHYVQTLEGRLFQEMYQS